MTKFGEIRKDKTMQIFAFHANKFIHNKNKKTIFISKVGENVAFFLGNRLNRYQSKSKKIANIRVKKRWKNCRRINAELTLAN